jgi:hypothetical protein
MNRRSFFKFLPVVPVALVAEGARACSVDDAPTGGGFLTLNGYEEEHHHESTNISFILPKPDPNRQVSMAVGKDGNLWLKKSKSEWKKVVVE